MSDYGTGGVLGAAISLPATSAMGILLMNNTNPVVLIGLIAICIVSFVTTGAHISRYLINAR